MAQKNDTTNLTELLLRWVAQPDSMLRKLEWLCSHFIKAEVSRQLDSRKISSTNVLERLNREIRRHTSAVVIFPNSDVYIRRVMVYLMEYTEDWSISRPYLCAQSLQDLLRLTA